MTAALLLWTLAWGYWAAESWRVSRRRAVKGQGHPQYFLAATAAGFLLVMSLGVHQAMEELGWYRESLGSESSSLVAALTRADDDADLASQLAPTLVWAPVLGVLLPLLLNAPLKRNPRLSNALARSLSHQEPIDELVVDCNVLEIPLMLTLKSGKVYVGHPIVATDVAPGSGQAGPQWLRLRPVVSGHRDEQHRFVPVTDYGEIRRTSVEGTRGNWLPTEAFDVVIPLGEITSAHPMDLIAYTQFRAAAAASLQDRKPTKIDSDIKSLSDDSLKLIDQRKARWNRERSPPTVAVIQYVVGSGSMLIGAALPLFVDGLAAFFAVSILGLLLLYRSGSTSADQHETSLDTKRK